METRNNHGHLVEVTPDVRPLERYAHLVGEERVNALLKRAGALVEAIDGASIWNVNSTCAGGGVAEMLRSLVGYARGAGINCRWAVIEGAPKFFKLTKRIHHALHGSPGDGTPLDAAARAAYEDTLRRVAVDIVHQIGKGDVVILHDPQTAGLVGSLLEVGARVIWRCHVGHDQHNDEVERGWEFLAPYVSQAEITVFSDRKSVV